MTRFLHILGRNERGASIIEFAISVPVLTLFVYGIFVIGQLFEANAGMQHALGEGARYATLCLNPSSVTGCSVPTDTAIQTKVSNGLFGTQSGSWGTPTISTSTANKTKTITVTYSQQMQFLFFTGPTVTLTRSKVVNYAT
ncbi:MAG TPA: TadE/TadG family type IV pilus assembly protein [Sphingomicrobium sp.]